ncbi:TetR/AcrR family transcriptional regulator [Rhodococcus sp. Z13]|uniref:TetR/AcrR family transcriptional regulator n=1 Tax=Rhodococcus sacchari TaxID=2962047 RepID=A0ACD4DJA3_9NOCA|nr:TetR/AcrR family transcriptional regulator [Rhodococcus sp. Z13]UYP20092.1 TetR/AcrR family transcriptional regulator [Rhodococcus sp. Z13]
MDVVTDDSRTDAAEARRTRLDPQQRRAQLIDLGLELLAERPLEQISVDEVAERAGVSRGLLFHYFASKHDFHVELVRHVSRELVEYTAPDEDLEPLGMLRGTLVAYVDFVTRRRDMYLSILSGATSGDPDMRAVFEDTRTAMVDRTVAHLPIIGIEPTPAVRLAVRGWIAFVEDTTIAWLRDPDLSRDEFIDLAVAALPGVALAAHSLAGNGTAFSDPLREDTPAASS